MVRVLGASRSLLGLTNYFLPSSLAIPKTFSFLDNAQTEFVPALIATPRFPLVSSPHNRENIFPKPRRPADHRDQL
ncbi:hypothetical protein B0T25DRAFT_547515, partial [Lasiosphaeria hispida]